MMIGVISKSGQAAAIKEFFQLFKTPWEFFREDRSYDVVIVTGGEIAKINARLLLVYGADVKSHDEEAKIIVSSRHSNARLRYQGIRVPIYGDTLIFKETAGTEVCATAESGIAGLKIDFKDTTLIRIGYDIFSEAEHLLTKGQPTEWASVPTLDIHVRMLRNWILEARLDLLEVPPSPAGSAFAVCLTHDVDFYGIRRHKFDHTFWGFLYRSTLGALASYVRGRTSFSRLLRNWQAAMLLPLVQLGRAKDFWLQFDWYLQIEKNLPATYFVIPFKNRTGSKLPDRHSRRRAVAYDITEIPELTAILTREGYEIGVHGIDAWHSVEMGRQELRRIAAATGKSEIGIRMHWLMSDENTFRVLEEAGYAYDSTSGYNETVGYLNGTSQVFCPLGTHRLFELPMNVQDGALFFSKRLGLSEEEAWRRCESLFHNANEFGGVLTFIWHDRSPGPERFWGEFYARLVRELKSQQVWFGTGSQVVNWFGMRRNVSFEHVESAEGIARLKVTCRGEKTAPSLVLRTYRSAYNGEGCRLPGLDKQMIVDIPWNGEGEIYVSSALETMADMHPHMPLRGSCR
jgi:peptidoglycan/xylan/chitin deacetylase (PgdA/CDA1 family)